MINKSKIDGSKHIPFSRKNPSLSGGVKQVPALNWNRNQNQNRNLLSQVAHHHLAHSRHHLVSKKTVRKYKLSRTNFNRTTNSPLCIFQLDYVECECVN